MRNIATLSQPKYVLLDNFNRYADSAVMNGLVPNTGPAWKTTGASLPTISGGKLVNSATGYLYTNLVTAPKTLGCRVTFSDATQSMTMAASNQTPPNLSIVSLAHLNFGSTNFTLGVFSAGGSFTSIMPGSWTSVLSGEGEVQFGFVNGTVFVVKGPSGEVFAVNDPQLAAVWGQMVFFEPTSSVCQASKVYALKNPLPFPGTTTWNPSDKTATITLSNGNLTAQCNAATAEPQARSVAVRTNGQVYLEFTVTARANAAGTDYAIGLASVAEHALTSYLGQDVKSVGFYPQGSTSKIYTGATPTNFTTFPFAVGDVGALAIDFTGKLWAKNVTQASGWNNDILANQNPATGTGGYSWTPSGAPFAICCNLEVLNDQITINTGGTNFVGTPPSGYVSWL